MIRQSWGSGRVGRRMGDEKGPEVGAERKGGQLIIEHLR